MQDERTPGEISRAETQHGAGRTLSRRTVIGGTAGVVALVAAGVVAVRNLQPAVSGKLVTPLLKSNPFYVAHHGGSADWPEMSMEAYRNSVAKGVDALELSLARTSDGVWFGLHDETLDRTSGTSGFVASEHTWNEVQQYRISPPATGVRGAKSQPYMRVEQLIDAYATTHAIFVDPKSVPRLHFAELLAIMKKSVDKPTETFIAKGYCTAAAWAAATRVHGYHSWGYYYAADIESDPALLSSTQEQWDTLGMNYDGSAAAWSAVKAYRKPVIGHIVPTRSAAHTALAKGASGLMVSGVIEVMG